MIAICVMSIELHSARGDIGRAPVDRHGFLRAAISSIAPQRSWRSGRAAERPISLGVRWEFTPYAVSMGDRG
jgi:hypothetical protein